MEGASYSSVVFHDIARDFELMISHISTPQVFVLLFCHLIMLTSRYINLKRKQYNVQLNQTEVYKRKKLNSKLSVP